MEELTQGCSILWTALPMEMVVEGLVQQPAAPMEMSVAGRTVLVEPARDGMGRVVRLLSTDPADFLDARWQPGTMVSLSGTNLP